MLSYDPRHHDGELYLFDLNGRERAKDQLLEDIPRLISDSGDVLSVAEFYEGIYNATPAHADDIHQAIIDNPDLEVLTPGGGTRRRASTIARRQIDPPILPERRAKQVRALLNPIALLPSDTDLRRASYDIQRPYRQRRASPRFPDRTCPSADA
jgi:hypothetical protein